MGTCVVEGINDCKSLNPFASKLWDYEKNNISPTQVFYRSENVYHFKCSKGHEFQRDLDGMYRSYLRMKEGSRRVLDGCPVCSKSLLEVGINDCESMNSYAFKYWDYSRNTVSPKDVYYLSHNKYWFLCGRGHSFSRSAYGMYRSYKNKKKSGKEGCGCPICSNRVRQEVISGVNDAYTLHYDLFKDRYDFDVNSQMGIDLLKLSETSTKRVFVRCSSCGELYETPLNWFISGKRKYCDNCKYLKYSVDEKGISKFIKSLGMVVFENYKISSYMSVDMYVPEKKIAFDYNGLYWHSEKKGRGRNYHKDKIDLCKSLGFRLYYIWEDDYLSNKNRVLSWIKEKLGVSNDRKVDARKCIIKYIGAKEASTFLLEYHIQGKVNMCSSYGLFYNEELVAVLSYSIDMGNPLYLNIRRYATSCNVRGGFSKILKVLEKKCLSEGLLGIVTFSDASISDGNLYNNCGFIKDSILPPDYTYLVGGKRVHKFNYRINRFKTDSNLKYEEGLSERELADLNKLYRVWDSGKIRWVKYIK